MSLKIKTSAKNISSSIVYFIILLSVLGIIGEIMCIYKFATSDFKPAYTREIVYGLGMITGTGTVVGWINIEDGEE